MSQHQKPASSRPTPLDFHRCISGAKDGAEVWAEGKGHEVKQRITGEAGVLLNILDEDP